ncbi:RcnB family protein [Sphingomonas hylomeconis]|uniref:RcnB family protein n=1 Tax=Sphingomonas hylomeconis TaxID=1395958 RepID=A0ABV7SUG4_9SPHN|nr:RcnB family protein [Sphingomonas hylomeconis]
MRTSLLAALMAATALIPGAAMAQRGDRGDNPGWQRGARQVQDGDRAPRARPQNEARPERPQAQPQAQPQEVRTPPPSQPDARPQPADGGGRGAWRGNDGGRPRDRGQGGFQPRPVIQPGVAPQPNRDRNGGVDRGGPRGPDRTVIRGDDNRGQWRGNDGRGNADRGQWRGNDNRGGQWRGNDNRGNVDRGQWRGNDNRGGQWRGNDGRGGNWNRNWRQDNRYDWNRRRQYNRNAYHLPRYYAPSGWRYGYRRFDIGFTLSSLLFNQNYWIGDASYYGLPEAYGEYRWVRYYNDALLVDIYSGEVVDTVYDIFW